MKAFSVELCVSFVFSVLKPCFAETGTARAIRHSFGIATVQPLGMPMIALRSRRDTTSIAATVISTRRIRNAAYCHSSTRIISER